MNNWQPIKTAPKDGTSIDIYCDSSRFALVDEYGRRIDRRYHKGYWITMDAGMALNRIPECVVTHWMPTPEPPEK